VKPQKVTRRGKWVSVVLSELRQRQRDPGVVAWISHEGADLLIAATALERGLTVVTRNLRHFEPTGVAIINPWQVGLER